MKRGSSIILIMLLFCGIYSAQAQLDTIPPIDRNIIMAEYFWDTDPGPGAGTPLLAADGNLDEMVESVLAAGISMPAAVGPHVFQVRVLDIDDGWGPVFRTIVHSFDPLITTNVPVIDVIQAEYFWDADPLPGNGTPMLAFDGAFDEMVETVIQAGIPVPPVAGPHTFNIRVESDDDGWGAVFSTLVHAYDPVITSLLPPISITQAEYFWDTDPGEGNATPILALDGALDETVEGVFQGGITTPGVVGPHQFNIRVKSEDGNWGTVFKTLVHEFIPVITDSLPSINVIQAEYFWDTDPGEGNGTPLLALDGTLNETVESAFAGGIAHPMPCGPHRFNVRAKSEDGQWGSLFKTLVYVRDTLPPTAACQDLTVYLDGNGDVSLDSNAIDDGSTDNCHIVAFELDTSQYNCTDVGDHPVMMTITDFAGFTDSCSSTVTVQDTISPVAICQDVTVYLDNAGDGSVTPAQVDAGSTDNCSVDSLTIDGSTSLSYTCLDLGLVSGLELVAYAGGLSSTACLFSVTIADTIPACNDRYWVGGTGSWSETAHWSYISGGPGGMPVPDTFNNVYFDVNSFTAPGQVVTMDVEAFAHDVDWSGVMHVPEWAGISSIDLNIYGSMLLDEEIQATYAGDLRFRSYDTETFKTGNNTFANTLIVFYNSGHYTLADSLLSDGTVYQVRNSATLDVSNNYLDISRLTCYNTSTIDITDSEVHCRGGGGFQTGSAGVSLMASGSEIYNYNFSGSIRGWNHNFHNVYFTATTTAANINAFATTCTFNKIVLGSNASTFGNIITDSLILTEGKTYTFQENYTITINNHWDVAGSCSSGQLTTLEGRNSLVANIATNFPVNITGVKVNNIEAQGPNIPFIANDSYDLGGNLNWTFASAARELYWVGGLGSWHDQSHWSITSGGTGGECIPRSTDNVYFDGNSFAFTNQSVSLLDVGLCHNMDWTGSDVKAPTFTRSAPLRVHGSMTLDSATTLNGTADIFFMSDSIEQIIIDKTDLRGDMRFNGTGTWNFMDEWNTFAHIEHNNGTINTNGHYVRLATFSSSDDVNSKVFNPGSSIVEVITSFDINALNYTFNASTSTIRLKRTVPSGTLTLAGYDGCVFNDVEFLSDVNSYIQSGPNDITFNNVSFTGNGFINEGSHTYNNLSFAAGKTYTLWYNQTQTILGQLNALGSCTDSITIKCASAAPTFPAYISKASDTVTLANVHINNVRATGEATFNAYSSSGVNDVGWNFIETYTYPDLTSCFPADSGWSIDTLDDQFLCDSIVTSYTTLLPSYDTVLQVMECLPASTDTIVELLSTVDGCDSIIRTAIIALPSQDIAIGSGWNMISSHIAPDEALLDSVYSEIDQDIIVVKNGAGQVYFPSIPFNQIGNWDVEQGYKVKATANQTLSIGCTPVDPAVTPVNLNEGWSIVSYLRDDAMDAEIALASLGDTLIIAKNSNGEVFIPALNFDNINDMLPGQGYQVKLAEAATLLYPPNTVRLNQPFTNTPATRLQHFTLDRNTGNNATVVVPEGSIEGIEAGDEIGIFNADGYLTGSMAYDGRHMAAAVWGNDALEGGNENMTDGEPYRYRLWRPSTGREYDLHVEYEQGLPYFTTNGISYIRSGYAEGLVTDVEEALELNTQVFVYPNPASHEVNIEVWLPESSGVLISIHDVAGKQVFRPRQEQLGNGKNILQIDLTQLAVGTYYYRIETRDGSFNGSLIKLK